MHWRRWGLSDEVCLKLRPASGRHPVVKGKEGDRNGLYRIEKSRIPYVRYGR